MILGIVTAVAVPLYLNQQKKAQDAAARSDVTTLGRSVAAWFVDHEDAPVLSQDPVTGAYTMGGDKVTSASTNVTLGPSHLVDERHWCVSVTNSRGDESLTGLEYSAEHGLRPGSC